VSRVECGVLTNVSTNISVAIFKVNVNANMLLVTMMKAENTSYVVWKMKKYGYKYELLLCGVAMEAAVAYFKVPSQYFHGTVAFEGTCYCDSQNKINV
jgi:hypothetical protein